MVYHQNVCVDVESSYSSKQTFYHICQICVVCLQCEYEGVELDTNSGQTSYHTDHICVAFHLCGLVGVFSEYHFERRISHTQYRRMVSPLYVCVCVLWYHFYVHIYTRVGHSESAHEYLSFPYVWTVFHNYHRYETSLQGKLIPFIFISFLGTVWRPPFFWVPLFSTFKYTRFHTLIDSRSSISMHQKLRGKLWWQKYQY